MSMHNNRMKCTLCILYYTHCQKREQIWRGVIYRQGCPSSPIHYTEVVVKLHPKLDILKVTNNILQILQAVIYGGMCAKFFQSESMVHLYRYFCQHTEHANVDLGSLEDSCVLIISTDCYNLTGCVTNISIETLSDCLCRDGTECFEFANNRYRDEIAKSVENRQNKAR